MAPPNQVDLKFNIPVLRAAGEDLRDSGLSLRWGSSIAEGAKLTLDQFGYLAGAAASAYAKAQVTMVELLLDGQRALQDVGDAVLEVADILAQAELANMQRGGK